MKAEYRVNGMTCEHCVASVTEEISDIDGVRSVDVRLDTGEVVVESDAPIPADEVRAAVVEAGYELVENSP